MNEQHISKRPRFNKKKRTAFNNFDVLNHNININDLIKVTIMNDLTDKHCDTIVNMNKSVKSEDDCDENSNASLLKVIFRNHKQYTELKSNVFNSIKRGLVGKSITMKENDDNNSIEIFENVNGHIQLDMETDKLSVDGDLFTIDTQPEEISINKKTSKVIEIPVYTTDKYAQVLLMADSINLKNYSSNKNKSGGMSCFNCGDNHNLKDCKKPRNHAKIQQRISQIKGGERYHIEPNQRYANVVPGKLSKELRNALGLRKHEIPSHVYRMRLFGYPPGWLEDHKISNSGLTLFDSDGKTVVGDSDEEQGEIVEKEKYDLNKIIEFPGFNVAAANPNLYDDYHRNRVPPMSDIHSKEVMIGFLSDKLVTPYKRKKLVNFPGANIKADDNNIEEHCMEIEDDDDTCGPILPPTTQPPLPTEEFSEVNTSQPPPPPDNTVIIASDDSGEIISEDGEGKSKNMESPIVLNTPLSNDLLIKSIEISTEELKEQIISDESSEINLCTTKFESNGTPLLQFSPYTSLPTGDKFSVGVSDVINFENLPDSTGKYENMKEILKRVRNQMERLHDDL